MVWLQIIQVLLLMNIIHLNKKVLLLIFFNFGLIVNVISQNEKIKNTNFALNITIGNGLIANFDNEISHLNSLYYSPTLRVLWKPNHLLNIGMESAYLSISKQDSDLVSTSFGNTIFKARLNAIPILLVFNMKISKLDIYSGIGISYLTSRLEAFQEKVVVNDWYYCYNLGIGYSHSLSKDFEIGIEAKSYFFPRIQKISGGIVVNISYYFLRW